MDTEDDKNCTLTFVSTLERSDSDPTVKGSELDFNNESPKKKKSFVNASFQGSGDLPGGEESASTKEIAIEEDVFEFRGLSKDEVVRRSEQPFWSRLRQAIYIIIFMLWAALIITLIVIAIIHSKCRAKPATSWWQGAVYYRIYVPTFKDSNSDCKGDFQGIVSKLDYLKEIGVDAVSLSPIYPEDNEDVEFSITNHTKVDSQYGNVEDLIDLINAVHKRGMYLVLDFIPNMTGKQHKWFQESKMSSGRNRNNFYVWVDGNSIPNNWKSQTNSSAWSFLSTANASFLHQVDSSLPDLNLRSAIVIDKLNDILRYWMSLGVDGFNLRHFGLLLEDYDLRDEPEAQPAVTNDKNAYAYLDHIYTSNLPENFYLLRLWRNLVNNFHNKTSILMTGMDSNGEDVALYETVFGRAELFSRPFIIFWDSPVPCDGFCMKGYISGKIDVLIKNSVIWMLGSDMVSRFKTRLHDDIKQQELLTMLTFLLPGSVLLYSGDEINMVDASVTKSWNVATKIKPWRSQMLWDDTLNSGFSNTSCSSFPLNENQTINVKNQTSKPSSMLNFIKNLARLRKESAFRFGDFQFGLVDKEVFSFVRGFDGIDCFLVAINLSNATITRNFASGPGAVNSDAKIKLLTPSSANKGTQIGDDIDTSSIALNGYEGIVVTWSCGLRQ